MTEDDSEASVGRREWLSVLGLGGALATVSGGSQPAQGAPVEDRYITFGPEDDPFFEFWEDGEDAVLEHSKTGATFKYDDDAGRWALSDPLEVAELDAIDTADFSQTAGPSHREGRLGYSSDQMSFQAFNDKSDVTLNVGEENVIRVTNQTGVTIQNGEAVFIAGAAGGDNPATVELAKADDTSTAVIAGLATMDIPNNEEGYVTSFGLVRDVDTSAFETGDPLWVSATTAGALTNTEPDSPNFSIPVGFVQKKSASAGQILVETGGPRPQIYTEDAVPFADAGGKLIEDPTNLNYDPGTDTLTTPALSTESIGVGDGSSVAGLISAALANGEIWADDGNVYTDMSDAEAAASNLLVIGPGTFTSDTDFAGNAALTVGTVNLTVVGSGRGTLLDGGGNDAVLITAAGVQIRNVAAKTTAGGGNSAIPFALNRDDVLLDCFWVEESDSNGVETGKDSVRILNGWIDSDNVDGSDIRLNGTSTGCIVDDIIGSVNDGGTGNTVGETA